MLVAAKIGPEVTACGRNRCRSCVLCQLEDKISVSLGGPAVANGHQEGRLVP